MKTLLNAALLLTLVSATAQAQINAGELKPESSLPFTMTQVATFKLPWRIAFLPDGRIIPPRDTEVAKTAPVISTYTVEGPNLAPSETWSTGHRTPYGLAFAPDGRLWEVEHGPRGGDELNLIEPGKNYGWPLVSYATSYNGVPIPSPDTRSDLTKPVIYWTPIIAPGNLVFYDGAMFPQWKGSALVSGIATRTLNRITFDGKGGAKPAERWDVGHRIRDVEVGPDARCGCSRTPIPAACSV